MQPETKVKVDEISPLDAPVLGLLDISPQHPMPVQVLAKRYGVLATSKDTKETLIQRYFDRINEIEAVYYTDEHNQYNKDMKEYLEHWREKGAKLDTFVVQSGGAPGSPKVFKNTEYYFGSEFITLDRTNNNQAQTAAPPPGAPNVDVLARDENTGMYRHPDRVPIANRIEFHESVSVDEMFLDEQGNLYVVGNTSFRETQTGTARFVERVEMRFDSNVTIDRATLNRILDSSRSQATRGRFLFQAIAERIRDYADVWDSYDTDYYDQDVDDREDEDYSESYLGDLEDVGAEELACSVWDNLQELDNEQVLGSPGDEDDEE